MLGADEAIGYEEEAETMRNEVRMKVDAKRQSEAKRKHREERRAQGLPEDDDDAGSSGDPTLRDEQLKAITDERIRRANIDKEAKIIIHQQVSGFEGTVTKTIDERGR